MYLEEERFMSKSLTTELPDEVYRKLVERAAGQQMTPEQLAGELIKQAVGEKKQIPDLKQDPAYHLGDLAEETGIKDLAANLEHYLYGVAKR
jgi:fructosamine-3-kinase